MSRLPVVLVAALCLASACSALSIDKTPVKVTHRNSGPRYDLDEEADRPRLTPVAQSAPEASEAASTIIGNGKKQEDDDKAADSDDQARIGHIQIRRIFLMPIVRPRPEWQEEAGESGPPAPRHPTDEPESQARPAMFSKPFWPFLTPERPSQSPHHMYGSDDASRSPSAMRPLFHRAEERPEREGERESEPQESRPAGDGREQLIDPIQMMLEMMQQVINGQMMPPTQPNSPDLNKEASSRGDGKQDAEQPSEERPKTPTGLVKPSATNETREDIVEIEGKKYLRKAVINRHVGENIIFMTKRLIFVPLNETDSASEQPSVPTTTSASETPSTTTVAPTTVSEIASTTIAASEVPTEDKSSTERAVEEVTITTAAAPSTTAPVSDQESTSKGSISERVSEAIGMLGRMNEDSNSGSSSSSSSTTTTTTTSTTEKPAIS